MRLTHRERGLFFGLVFFVIAWGLFVFAVKPALARIEVLSRVIPEKSSDLQDIKAKSKQYLALKNELDEFKRKASSEAKDFELLTFLESTVRQDGLTEKVTTMKQKISMLDSNYSEVVVEVDLENITLEQMLELLIKIKSSTHSLRIKSLYTKKSTSIPSLLDTVIQISTLKPSRPM